MIDFLFGVLSTLGALYLFHHFKGQSPAKIASDLTNWKMEIKMAIADALNELKAAAEADKAAAVAKAVAEAVAPAQAAQESADEQAVRDFTAATYPPAA